MRRVRRLGVMGGTFDPIHYGHLVTAEEAWSQLHLDEVLFVPSGRPPHKKDRESLDPEYRYLMVAIATAENRHFQVSRVEIDRPGLSYTIDTIEELKKVYGTKTDIFFITGADAILEILTWKEPERILEECYLVAATRPGYDLDKLKKALPPRIRKRMDKDGRIIVLEIPSLSISSTDIRERVRTGRSIKYLVPEGIAEFIEKNGFYR